ncbi:MAG: hypothetical protein V7K50_16105 [Nostoc sp.]|uniref:hypothetical protein n=1 Tax=Nostoc sp. TaxID=1180 RepID=UPI002FF65F6E
MLESAAARLFVVLYEQFGGFEFSPNFCREALSGLGLGNFLSSGSWRSLGKS